jgi:hypothetical protein
MNSDHNNHKNNNSFRIETTSKPKAKAKKLQLDMGIRCTNKNSITCSHLGKKRNNSRNWKKGRGVERVWKEKERKGKERKGKERKAGGYISSELIWWWCTINVSEPNWRKQVDCLPFLSCEKAKPTVSLQGETIN